MGCGIFRIEKHKAGDVGAIQKHHLRQNRNYSNADINPERTSLNTTLYLRGNSFQEQIDRIIEEGYKGSKKIRKDAIVLVDGIITASPDFFEGNNEGAYSFFRDATEWLENEFGKQNLVYVTRHLDETTPHLHFGFVPLTEEGRLSAKEVLGGREGLSRLQDSFHEKVGKKYGLARGKKKTGRKHKSVADMKEQTEQELQELQEQVAVETERLELVRQERIEAERRVSVLERGIESLRSRISELGDRLKELMQAWERPSRKPGMSEIKNRVGGIERPGMSVGRGRSR